jgi:hypothetical protein
MATKTPSRSASKSSTSAAERRESRVQSANGNGMAFGETLGIEVPTRYTEEIHAMINGLLAVDKAITPAILGFSGKTVWMCRILSGVMLAFRTNITELPLRRRLEIEAALGALVVIAALRGMITHRFFDNAYLFITGAIMIANALMTEAE